jgi:small ligand-binding sensory domain FIST
VTFTQPATKSSTGLRCAAAISTAADMRTAVREVAEQALDQLNAPVDLAIFFTSLAGEPGGNSDGAESGGGALAAALCDALATDRVIGCTGESIVGPGREVEESPALALWVASMPGATIELLRLTFERSPEGGAFVGWPASLEGRWPPEAGLLLLGEPFSFPADALLERLNEDRPGALVAGGMASGGHAPGDNSLWLGQRRWSDGAVGAWVHGGVRFRSVVSQGCRPIGRPLVVTKADRNVIHELGGKPALAAFSEIYAALTPEEQALARGGMHVGRVVNEYQDGFARGDFLIRNVIGADRDIGAIAIGDYARVGQTVQFHVRDAHTADEDLTQLLSAARGKMRGRPAGALMFTCNGRGTRLFEQPHHDAAALAAEWPGLPVAGFFAQGEIGPIGGRNFLHGFTASIVLLEAAPET